MNQQTLLEGLLQSTPDGIAIFDSNHRMVFVNQQYCDLWEETAQRLCAMSRQDLYNLKISRLYNPEMDAHLLQLTEAPAATHERVQVKLKNSRWYECLTFEYLVNGATTGHVVQWRDITTDRVDLSTAHHERDLMYAMMDKVHDAMFFKDLESRYIRVNTSMARRLGLSDSALAMGLSDADFYSGEHATITRAEELDIMATRMPLLNQVHRETWAD
jgi:PAS domain-containing protein